MKIECFKYKRTAPIEKPAIWFRLHDRVVMVYPFALYHLLWNCDREESFCQGVKARFQIFKEVVCGHYQDDELGYYNEEYQRNNFLESAIQTLKEICDTIISGKETAYKDLGTDATEKIQVGLQALIIPRNYSQIKENEIKIEPFSFNFTEPFNCDTRYEIKIGERKYDSYLSEWRLDFNLIRMEMEKSILIYFSNSEIKMNYEDSPTIIHLDNPIIWEPDISLSKKKVVRVTIIPDEFHKEPNMYGWCEPQQMIRSLYLGLLGICIRDTDWFDDGYDGNWNDYRLASYNKLQSCVIENYINGIREEENSFMPRQRVISSVDEMIEDYQRLCHLLGTDNRL